MADDARDMSNETFLAAELDGEEVKMTVPRDPMVARLLLEHLRHAIETRDLTNAIAVRAKVSGANGIVRGDARMLRGFKGPNN